MSFRRRLLVSVFLILLVPIGAIALLLVQLAGQSRAGKADARLAGALPAALTAYDHDLAKADAEAHRIATSPTFLVALSEPAPRLQALLQQLARADRLARLELTTASGRPIANVQPVPAVASESVELRDSSSRVRDLIVSRTPAASFTTAVARLTGMQAAVAPASGAVLAATAPGAERLAIGGSLPRSEDVTLPSGDYRARIVALPDVGGQIRLALLAPAGSSGLSSGEALIGLLLAIFVLLSLALTVPLLRDLQRLHDSAAEQAITDELTGLSNRRRFGEIMLKEAERAKRFERPFSLVMLDLDDFKKVNDTYGHLQGDHVLRKVADLLTDESREVDEPARWGGEEFAIALPETDIEGAHELADRIRDRMQREPIKLDGLDESIAVSASVGVSGTPEQDLSAGALIAAADEALYRAKREGKNRVARGNRTRAADASAG